MSAPVICFEVVIPARGMEGELVLALLKEKEDSVAAILTCSPEAGKALHKALGSLLGKGVS